MKLIVNTLALETLSGKIEDPTKYVSAVESFNLFTSLLDTSVRLFHNIRVSLMSSSEGIRRSELEAFHHAHRKAWEEFIQQKNITLLRQKIPIPTGMRVTYKAAMEHVLREIEQLKIEDTLAVAQVCMHQLEHGLMHTDDLSTLQRELDETMKRMHFITRKDIHAFVESIIDDKGHHSITEKVANEVLHGYADILEVDAQILSLVEFYRKLTGYNQQLGHIEKTLDGMVKSLHERDLPKQLLKTIHRAVFTLALQFDMLGAIGHISQMIEHNFALAMYQLVNNRK